MFLRPSNTANPRCSASPHSCRFRRCRLGSLWDHRPSHNLGSAVGRSKCRRRTLSSLRRQTALASNHRIPSSRSDRVSKRLCLRHNSWSRREGWCTHHCSTRLEMDKPRHHPQRSRHRRRSLRCTVRPHRRRSRNPRSLRRRSALRDRPRRNTRWPRSRLPHSRPPQTHRASKDRPHPPHRGEADKNRRCTSIRPPRIGCRRYTSRCRTTRSRKCTPIRRPPRTTTLAAIDEPTSS